MKKYIDKSEYWELLLVHLQDYLEVMLNDEAAAVVIKSLYLKSGQVSC